MKERDALRATSIQVDTAVDSDGRCRGVVLTVKVDGTPQRIDLGTDNAPSVMRLIAELMEAVQQLDPVLFARYFEEVT